MTHSEWFCNLYTEAAGKIEKYFRKRLTLNKHLSEDFAADVFLKAWVAEYDEQSTPMRWLYRIARNRLWDYWRQQRVEVVQLTADMDKPVVADFQQLEDAEWGAQVLSCLLPRTSNVIEMTAAGYDATEIGELMSIEPNAVRQLRWRARRALERAGMAA